MLFLLGSCADNKAVEVITLSSPPQDTLQVKPLNLPVTVFKPQKVVFSDNNLVFFDGVGKGVFKVFNLSDYQYLFTYPETGNELQQHDFIDVNSMTSQNGTFNYLDYPVYRQVEVNLRDSTFRQVKQTDLSGINQDINRLVQLNDTLYTAKNFNPENNVDQSLLFSSVTSSVLKTFGKYPEEGIVFETPEEKESQYRYSAVSNEQLGRIAVFYGTSNRIRFYDFTGELVKEVRVGPYSVPQIPKDRKIYFVAPRAIGNKIYVLYLNQNHVSANEAPETIRPELHVYNWQGELLNRSYIDAPVYAFDISATSDRLIGISFLEDSSIVEASLQY